MIDCCTAAGGRGGAGGTGGGGAGLAGGGAGGAGGAAICIILLPPHAASRKANARAVGAALFVNFFIFFSLRGLRNESLQNSGGVAMLSTKQPRSRNNNLQSLDER